jgi:hypothetical protein
VRFYILILLVVFIAITATTGCDSFKRGFDEGYNRDETESIEQQE